MGRLLHNAAIKHAILERLSAS
ncbi:hypothetical protein ACCAA_430004 [Candidatus Accumulibacter aalborgensis]|uniref:Uncharacterized protein n=1 Tax=Candidatus Accumulibacter aalborgensis TaxID=1860102 RepID=A0A1A8XQF3_9PROT|nr:hypothetical protein ACCAA_430004 [Candidatus Accumulibacter aalborgensis]